MGYFDFWKSSSGKVGIIGSGSWATAIAKMLYVNDIKVNWYFRDERKIDKFKETRSNPGYLSAVKFDVKKLNFYSDINQLIKNSEILIFVTPSPYLKATLNLIEIPLNKKFIISAVKGIIPVDNLLISEYFHAKYGVPEDNIAVLTGPCHAEEVAMERLSYITIGCTDGKVGKKLSEIFNSSFVKTSTSLDVIGLEYAAVLKNIYAIAAGICHGLKYGDNFNAILLSNSTQEMSRFCDVIYPTSRNINLSGYLGDLLVTAYSNFSRNRTFGTMIGNGYSVKAAQLEMAMVAEGYYATKCIKELNERYKVKMPIVDAVYAILYEKQTPSAAIARLTEFLA